MTYVVTKMGRRMMRPLAKSRFHEEDVAISVPVGEWLSALSFAEGAPVSWRWWRPNRPGEGRAPADDLII